MSWAIDLGARLGIGLAVFVSSNVDDLVLLAAFFSSPRFSARAVVLGQFVGIGTLVVVSAVAALSAGALPPALIRLLGIVPIGIGLHQLVSRVGPRKSLPESAVFRTRSQIFAVAGTTVANGGDNLGIYVPLFASSVGWISFFALLFAALTAVWCSLAFSLATHRLTAPLLTHHARRWLPLVLVGLGVYILLGAPISS